jgi:hypothetical protein
MVFTTPYANVYTLVNEMATIEKVGGKGEGGTSLAIVA